MLLGFFLVLVVVDDSGCCVCFFYRITFATDFAHTHAHVFKVSYRAFRDDDASIVGNNDDNPHTLCVG